MVFSATVQIPVTKAVDERRLLFGWANIPATKAREGFFDLHGEQIPLEDIEHAVYDFQRESRQMDEQHDGAVKGVSVESFVATPEKYRALGVDPDTDGLTFGWWFGGQVDDPETYARSKAGDLPMFSVELWFYPEEVDAPIGVGKAGKRLVRRPRIVRVSLVNQGANYDPATGEGSHVVLWKSAAAPPSRPSPAHMTDLAALVRAGDYRGDGAFGLTPAERAALPPEAYLADGAYPVAKVVNGKLTVHRAAVWAVTREAGGGYDDELNRAATELLALIDDTATKAGTTHGGDPVGTTPKENAAGQHKSGTDDKAPTIEGLQAQIATLMEQIAAKDAEIATLAAEAAGEGENAPPLTDAIKGLPENVQRLITDMDARTKEAEKQAKAAMDSARAEEGKRLDAEFKAKAATFTVVPFGTVDAGKMLKTCAAVGDGLLEQVEQVLRACDEALKATKMLEEIGEAGHSTRSVGPITTDSELDKAALDLMKEGKATNIHQARRKVAELRPDLFRAALRQ